MSIDSDVSPDEQEQPEQTWSKKVTHDACHSYSALFFNLFLFFTYFFLLFQAVVTVCSDFLWGIIWSRMCVLHARVGEGLLSVIMDGISLCVSSV